MFVVLFFINASTRIIIKVISLFLYFWLVVLCFEFVIFLDGVCYGCFFYLVFERWFFLFFWFFFFFFFFFSLKELWPLSLSATFQVGKAILYRNIRFSVCNLNCSDDHKVQLLEEVLGKSTWIKSITWPVSFFSFFYI